MVDENAPPEPREPAAREWLDENRVKFLTGETVYPYGHSTEKIEYLDEAAMLEAYSAELRAERDQVEAELQRVRDDREDVCNRLDTAESRIQYLETADIQRAKDITRVTIERDAARETNRELNRRNQELTRSLNLETGRKAWYGYFQAALHLLRGEGTKREAAERSLLQARAEMKTRLERALADAKDINGYVLDKCIGRGERLLKVAGHTTGMIIRLERELASTSAPEGTAK